MADYVITIYNTDESNVQADTHGVIHGNTTHYINITSKTYNILRRGSNIPDTMIPQVWTDNLGFIKLAIPIEIQRLTMKMIEYKLERDESSDMRFITGINLLIDQTLQSIAMLQTYLP